MVDGWFLGDFFWGVEGSSAHTRVTCSSHVAINVHGNYYYMVEGSPHVWLTCTVINVQGNNYYMGGREPSCAW